MNAHLLLDNIMSTPIYYIIRSPRSLLYIFLDGDITFEQLSSDVKLLIQEYLNSSATNRDKHYNDTGIRNPC